MTRPWRALALVATCGALAATAGCGGSEDGPEAASASAARLPPSAAANAFRSSRPATGTTATARPLSTSATSVLKIRSYGTPSASAASSP